MTNKLTNVVVRGMVTKVYLQSPKNYYKHAPKNSVAYIDWESRTIYFQTGDISKETIRHELTHAFIKASFTEQIPNLSLEQIEEVFCEVVSHFGPTIISMANKMHKEMLYLTKEAK